MKKIINLLVLLFVIFIAGCSSGGSSGNSSGGGTPIQIGSLPNGSSVYISQNDLPITAGTPAQAEIYLEGGSPNESYNIVFATNQQLQSKLKANSVESYGINVTTAPTPCIIGTAGSGAPSKCQITVASSANTYPGTYLITPTATPVSGSGTATILSPLTILVSGSITPNTKAITSFSLNGTAGVITGQNIAVTMPFGTNLTALVATYITTGQSVKVGSVTQANGVTPNNFTNPVIYTVIAEDSTTQNYTVTVTVAQNSAKAITAFSLDGTAGVISGQNIAVTMPYGTDVTALIATFSTTGQSVTVGATPQVSGVTSNNFTNPVTYVVMAEDGTTQSYTVTVTVASDWEAVGSVGFSNGQAEYQSLALAPDGTPYVAYKDSGDGGKTVVMKFDGTNWVNVGSAVSSGSASYQSLAIAVDGTPYVAYKDDGVGANKATVMKFDGTNWIVVGSAGFSAGVATYLSLAIAPSGTANAGMPYVAYNDAANSNKTTVMKFDGTSWVDVGSPGFSTNLASFQSLKIAANGTPYVAYQDGAIAAGKTTVMKFDGTSWVNVGSSEFSAGKATYQSLALTTDGTPYVSYVDGTNLTNSTTVMKFDGTSWVTVGSAKFTPSGTNYTSLVIATDGTPYVAQMVNGKATVMTFTGTNWVDVGTPEFSAGTLSKYPSLVINNATGELYIAYRDSGNGSKTTVMGY